MILTLLFRDVFLISSFEHGSWRRCRQQIICHLTCCKQALIVVYDLGLIQLIHWPLYVFPRLHFLGQSHNILHEPNLLLVAHTDRLDLRFHIQLQPTYILLEQFNSNPFKLVRNLGQIR